MALSSLWRRTTGLDRLLAATLLAATLASFALVGRAPVGARLVVERDGAVIFTAPLQSDRQVRLQGRLGAALLEIRGGRACFREATCPNRVCIGMGEVTRSGELLACVPNGLLVRIEGPAPGEQGYDLLSR